MTIQFSQVDTSEPRLLPDNSKPFSPDQSFEEKLQEEQARLGLLFAPFAQIQNLFSANQFFESLTKEASAAPAPISTGSVTTQNSSSTSQPSFVFSNQPAQKETQVFSDITLQPFNKQLLQSLLSRSGWLTPNIAASPLFYQASLENRLQPTLDLQALVDEIIKQVKLVKDKGKTELTIGLKPEDLGDILLTLTARSGIVSIQIKAEAEAKKLIEADLADLKKALKKAGVSFDEITIESVGQETRR